MKFSDNQFEGTFWTDKTGDWYVSTIGSDISGIGDGSPKRPFLTVRKAFEAAVDGDKIVIGPDQYVTTKTSTGGGGSLEPCKVATIENIPLAILGRSATIDTEPVETGDRVLVWLQDIPEDNGVYIVADGGWQRADDFNNIEEINSGAIIPILSGIQYGQKLFQRTGDPLTQLGFSPINFTQILDKSNLGLGNVDNTADLVKPVSVPQQNLLDSAISALKDNVPAQGDTLNKLYDLIQEVIGVSASATNIAARDAAKASYEDQQNIYVEDASGDPTVTSGWAIYKYLAQPEEFIKIAEEENIDLSILQAGNGISIAGNQINLGGNANQPIYLNMSDKVFEVNFDQGDQRGGLLVGSPDGDNPVDITTTSFNNTQRTSFTQEIRNNTPIGRFDSVDDTKNDLGSIVLRSSDVRLGYRNNSLIDNNRIQFRINGSSSFLFVDDLNKVGAQYEDDYSTNNLDNPRWIPDKAYVDGLLETSGAVLTINAKWEPHLTTFYLIDFEGKFEIALKSASETGGLRWKRRIKPNGWDDNNGALYSTEEINLWGANLINEELELGCVPISPKFDTNNDGVFDLETVGCIIEIR